LCKIPRVLLQTFYTKANHTAAAGPKDYGKPIKPRFCHPMYANDPALLSFNKASLEVKADLLPGEFSGTKHVP